MAGRNFLFVPGPTNVPDRVQRAMVVAMEDHRSSKFPELTLDRRNAMSHAGGAQPAGLHVLHHVRARSIPTCPIGSSNEVSPMAARSHITKGDSSWLVAIF